MTEFKSFSVVVNLHHFLNDHRSISRIFINKRLKSIGDLHSHIANIYNIKNFYFVCNNQYLPSSENIRVLQPEDTVIAFPDKSVDENQIVTNTRCAEQYANKCLSQDKDIDSLEVAPLAVESKKNRKRKLNEPAKLNDVCSVEVPQATKKHKKKLQKAIEEVTCEDSGKHKKANKKRKVDNCTPDYLPDLQTSLPDLKSSVKEKVSYFEENSKSTENLLDNSTNKTTREGNLSLQRKETSNVVGHSNFKNRGVLVKRYNDIISFDLPKETNVVKNIIVLPEFHKQIGANVKENSHKEIEPVMHVTPQLQQQSDANVKENTNIKNNLVNSQLHKQIGTDVKEINITENFVTPKFYKNAIVDENLPKGTSIMKNLDMLSQLHKQVRIKIEERSQHVFESPITRNIKEESVKNTPKIKFNCSRNADQILGAYSSASEDKADTECSFQDAAMPEIKDAINNVHPKKISRYSVEVIHDQTVANASKPREFNQLVSETSPRMPATKASSEVELLLNEDRSCDLIKSDGLSIESAPSFINLVDTTNDTRRSSDFVTKRKRRRTHRKRKSTMEVFSVSQALVTSTPYEYQPPKIQTVPAIHITFDEECEPSPVTNCKNDDEDIRQEIPVAPDDDCILQMDLTSDAQNESSKCDDESKVSESIILNAPIMDKISPKTGDLIAFKILRMSEAYTPELSTFIVAKVLGFHEATKEIAVYIVDGADQFMEPQGKFAVPLENDSANSNLKNFSWYDFIEPRLLFP